MSSSFSAVALSRNCSLRYLDYLSLLNMHKEKYKGKYGKKFSITNSSVNTACVIDDMLAANNKRHNIVV